MQHDAHPDAWSRPEPAWDRELVVGLWLVAADAGHTWRAAVMHWLAKLDAGRAADWLIALIGVVLALLHVFA